MLSMNKETDMCTSAIFTDYTTAQRRNKPQKLAVIAYSSSVIFWNYALFLNPFPYMDTAWSCLVCSPGSQLTHRSQELFRTRSAPEAVLSLCSPCRPHRNARTRRRTKRTRLELREENLGRATFLDSGTPCRD